MATGDLPAPGSEQVTATAPAVSDKIIPLPPAQSPAPDPSLPGLERRLRLLDVCLVGLVLVFAFVVASFKASNSDLFLHLSAGRLVAQGKLFAAEDPFSYGATGVWVNHSWLFDLGLYLLYSATGAEGVGLVIAKALLVVLLAEVLLRAGSRAGQRLWIPATFALLAVLAMSPRLLLQPTIVSFLLLGVTVWLLGSGQPRRLWLLPPLCLLWVNLDEWFFLGPLAMLLFLLGELVQSRIGEEDDRPTRERLGTLGLVLAASVAACLVNPYHVRAFTLPMILDPTIIRSDVARDVQFRSMFWTPFHSAYWQQTVGVSPAGLSWLLLLAAGLASFGLTFGRWRWWRLFVFVGFAALAAINLRCVPFFAVVAGPVAALNFLDLARDWYGLAAPAAGPARRWALGGRLLTAVAAVALTVASLPGWLQAPPRYARQVGWGVVPDPGLKAAAEQIAAWRDEGAFEPGQKWFNLSPEVPYYLAWYAPGERGFLDHRLPLFRQAAGDYLRVRQSLAAGDPPQKRDQAAMPVWEEVLDDQGVRRLIFHGHSIPFYTSTLERLYFDPTLWRPCFVGGRTAVFVWEQKNDGRTDPRMAIDFTARAFGQDAVRAPDAGPPMAVNLTWYQTLLEREAPPASEANTSIQHLLRHQGQRARDELRRRRFALDYEVASAASVVGLAGQPSAPFHPTLLLPARMNLAFTYVPGRADKPPQHPAAHIDQYSLELAGQFAIRLVPDLGPPDALYLAVRAGRAGVRENPNDAAAWLVLARAFGNLAQDPREWNALHRRGENQVVAVLPQAELIRRTQITWALNNALKHNPQPQVALQAHQLLYQTYFQGYQLGRPEQFQPAVKHFKETIRLARLVGVVPDVPAEKAAEALKQLDARAAELDKQLQRSRSDYTVATAKEERVVERARQAAMNGLAEEAVDLLLKADAKEMEERPMPGASTGATQLLSLLLSLGRLDEAAQLLLDADGSEHKGGRNFGPYAELGGVPAYPWFLLQLSAANGDYARADRAAGLLSRELELAAPLHLAEELRRLEILPTRPRRPEETSAADFAALLLGHVLLRDASWTTGPATWWHFVMFRLQPPYLKPPRRYVPKLPSPAGPVPPIRPALLGHANAVLQHQQGEKADLWTVRAWLALEWGQTNKVGEYAQKALAEVDIGTDTRGVSRKLPFRSRQLLELCMERVRSAKAGR